MRIVSPSELFATLSSPSSHGSPRVSSLLASTPPDSLPILEDSSVGASAQTTPRSVGGQRLRGAHVFVTMLVSTAGPCILSLPFTFAVLSTAHAVALMVVVGACSALTALALLHAHSTVAKREELAVFVGAGCTLASYRSMGTSAGGKGYGVFVSVIVAIGIFGGCVGGIRIVKDAMPHLSSLLYELLVGSSFDSLATKAKSTLETLLLWSIFIFVALPMCCLKDVSKLKLTNYVALLLSVVFVVAVVYRGCTTGVVDLQSLSFRTRAYDGDPSEPVDKATVTQPTELVPRSFQAISLYTYAFAMQLNVLPLFVELRGNFDAPIGQTTYHMGFVICCVTAVCSVLYILFGVFGARLYGTETHGNFLINLRSDPFMKLPLIAMYSSVLLSFPPLFIPGRIAVEELTSRKPAAGLPLSFRITAAAAFLSGQLLVATWAPRVEIVYALLGATTTVLTCFVFPVVMFTGLFPWQRFGFKGQLWCVVLWAIAVFMATSGLRTTVFLFAKT